MYVVLVDGKQPDQIASRCAVADRVWSRVLARRGEGKRAVNGRRTFNISQETDVREWAFEGLKLKGSERRTDRQTDWLDFHF